MKNLSERELACVLAALAFWRREGPASAGIERDIASGDGAFEELSGDEVGSLIEELGQKTEPMNYVCMADKLNDIVQCFSRNGEFNTHSAPLGTVEVREVAVEVRDAIQRLSEGESILPVMMQDLIGDYDMPTGPEWKWVEENASYPHRENGQRDGIWEFVLNLSRTFEGIPKKLKPTIEKARRAGFGYVLFHQGT